MDPDEQSPERPEGQGGVDEINHFAEGHGRSPARFLFSGGR
jgi:hypothetical protein